MRISCPTCWISRAASAPTRCIPSCWFPVGCGVDIAAEQMVPPEEYERMLNWFYDQSLTGDIELKATCAPHYFRVRAPAPRRRSHGGTRAACGEPSHPTKSARPT